MLTIFACPKPFTDPHIAVIQRNAIRSWSELGPDIQIILFGDEAGVETAARELCCENVPNVVRNELGTPLLNDMIARAEMCARHIVLCYVNADIILMQDFMGALRSALAPGRGFLLGGRPRNLDVRAPLEFTPGWDERLHEEARSDGVLRPIQSCDYFVFRKGLWGHLPPFAIGRCYFDNALLFLARQSGAWLIDATEEVDAIHQDHSYAAGLGGAGYLANPEALRNVELAGGRGRLYDWRNATHTISSGQVRRIWYAPAVRFQHVCRHYLWLPLLNYTRPFRNRLRRWRSACLRAQ